MNKLLKINNLIHLRSKFKKKKIVLVHGVYDLLHMGHIEYFKEAKSMGDILVVSVTSNKFVNKGVNRPYFDEKNRIALLNELSDVDYTVLSPDASAVKVIKNLKPNFYVKGPDYRIKENDKAGNLDIEKKEVIKNGGQLKITHGKVFSSTKILNYNFDEFQVLKKIKSLNSFNKIDYNEIINDYSRALKKISKEKVLVIGETILDNYYYSESLGTPSKENILSVNFLKKDEYIGGALPVALNISNLSKNVTFVSFYKDKKIIKKIKSKENKKIKFKFFHEEKYKEIKKNRFIDINTKRKFFEFYEFNNQEFNNSQFFSFLKKNIQNYDKVIVCDFGHGMFNKSIVKILEKKSKFLCVNVQTNSGNRGYNLYKKFDKANLLVLDEPEIRLGLTNRYKTLEKIITSKELKNYKNLMVTRGIKGLMLRDKLANKGYYNFPALNTQAVDTMGAGDAAFAYACMFINSTKRKILVGLLSSIAGAIKTTILGHEKFLDLSEVTRTLEGILKE